MQPHMHIKANATEFCVRNNKTFLPNCKREGEREEEKEGERGREREGERGREREREEREGERIRGCKVKEKLRKVCELCV